MRGIITFYFKNSFTIKKQIGSNCKGILVKGERPINFILDIDQQSISSNTVKEEVTKFNRWLNDSVFPNIADYLTRKAQLTK